MDTQKEIQMRIMYDNLPGKVWINGTSPILFIRLLNGDFEFLQYRDLYTSYRKQLDMLFAVHKERHISFDPSEFNGIDEESQISNCGRFLKKLIMVIRTTRVKYFALAKFHPDSCWDKFLLIDDILRTEPALKIERFDTSYKAAKQLSVLPTMSNK